MDENEVAPDDVVFHKFYQTKVSNRKVKKAKHKKDEEDEDITGIDEVDGIDGDDSDEEEVDALLERDEGREMGSAGEEDPEGEDGDESEGEFDYDELEHTFDMEEDEELEGEDFDTSPKKKKKKKKIVETATSDSDESYGSEDEFDLGEYPESEAEEDSDGSIEIGDLPSDEESKPSKKRTVAVSDKGVKQAKVTGEGKAKKKLKNKQVDAVQLPSGKKSAFASLQDYEDIIERDQTGGAPKDKGRKGKGKKSKSSRD